MGQIYVTSDTHGQYDTFMEGINELIKPGDQLFFLGDAIDRGPKGFQLLAYLLGEEEKTFDIKMLRGNHESMFLEFFDEIRETARRRGLQLNTVETFLDIADELSFDSYWIRVNGGEATLLDLRRNVKSIEELNDLYGTISNLPYHAEAVCFGHKYYMVHGSPCEKDCEGMLWKPSNVIDDYSQYGDYVIFGHKITWHYNQGLSDKSELLKVFYGNNRIGIDTGAAYPELGGCISFLRLSDLKAFYFRI